MHEHTTLHRRDEGFSLAESLIATMLTLMVVGSGLSLFSGSVRLGDTARVVSETNQGLQVGMSLMIREFIQAGHGVPRGGIPIPSGAGSNAMVRPGPGALTFPAAWTTLPAVSPGSNLGPTLLGVQTDIVTLVYEDPTIALSQYPLVSINTNTDQIRVDPRTSIVGPDGLKAGDLILFSNAIGNALRMVTNIPVNNPQQVVTLAPGDPLGLNQINAAQGSLQNISTAPNVFPITTATRVVMSTYYVDSTTDPTLPRLVRRVNAAAPLAIALGVENLQVTYDLVDGVTNPSNVPEPPPANSPHQIRKVNLFLSARSLDPLPRSLTFFRNSVATQVGLRSLSFVDRYK
jgi:hypothetical protein